MSWKRKIALEEHLSTQLNNNLWDAVLEVARKGKAYKVDVESGLLDVDRRLEDMDRNGTDIAIVSLTFPGAQSNIDPCEAVEFACKTNDEIIDKFTSRNPERLRQGGLNHETR